MVVGVSLMGEEENSLLQNKNGSLSSTNALEAAPSVSSGTLNAEITPETIDFFVSDAEGDPDSPTKGYSSIEEALITLRSGKFVIAVDDENDQVEGNLVMAASLVNSQAIAFMVKNGSGIVSVGMAEEDLERLNLPLMSPDYLDKDSSVPSFTITVV